ncbi:metallo-beta-lactamase superfamily protein [Chlamydia ibidis]|uniref:Metallo-beta-lactamase superfamily protein n=2 Tax=Chlamydia ibidis TaxID=1405396 RepID=S7J5D3_9CHLA|nr:MBL fold metallo-hydrolase [Chlamydia ibidis]EPP35438.1 metallo-beta-lactamase superfamily protein [Chlamydia ibidis]EQM62978.1 metallo-beta-lactamase superfamily protein [Chlamydia ibidis 10-1398/6]
MQDTVGKLKFLGTGDPEGIPVAFCSCSVCLSDRNSRLRASVLISWQGNNYVVDAGPDFREQMLRYRINNIAGVFLTHPHYDHIGGLDDLRAWYVVHQQPVSIVLSASTYTYLSRYREHLVRAPGKDDALPSALNFTILNEDYGSSEFYGLPYSYVSYYQKSCHVTGYRFGNLAYITDLSRYDREIFSHLSGVDTLIMSASPSEIPKAFLGRTRSHLTIRDAENFADYLGVNKLIFTHISHHLQKELDSATGKLCAYDGMELSWMSV